MSNGGQCLEHYTFIYQINSRPRIYLSLCIRCTADHRVSAIRMSFLNTKWKTWTIHFSNEWNIYTIQRNVATLITVICRIHFILDTKSARGKKMVLSTPHDEFWISWRDIWGKGNEDRYVQAPQIYLVISHTYYRFFQSLSTMSPRPVPSPYPLVKKSKNFHRWVRGGSGRVRGGVKMTGQKWQIHNRGERGGYGG